MFMNVIKKMKHPTMPGQRAGPAPGGEGVHDLRMDGGLPPGIQKATLFELPTVAAIPIFMMNFGGKLPIFDNFCQFLGNPPMFKENLPKKRPLFREFWTQKPTHMGGTYPYPQHVMLPPWGPPLAFYPTGCCVDERHFLVFLGCFGYSTTMAQIQNFLC